MNSAAQVREQHVDGAHPDTADASKQTGSRDGKTLLPRIMCHDDRMDGTPRFGTPSPGASIGDTHRRAIAARLSQIETQMIRADWPVEAGDTLELLARTIGEMRVEFGIPSSRQLHRGTAAALAFMWLEVDELRPARLRAYGELTPEESAHVDVSVTRLTALIAKLGERVGHREP